MTQYTCTILFDASASVEVDAETPEAAAEKALDERGHVTICHQCSEELEIGDACGVMVYDNDATTQALDTTWAGQRIAKLEARIRELEAKEQPNDE